MNARIITRILAATVIALPTALLAIDSANDGLDDSVETNTGVTAIPQAGRDSAQALIARGLPLVFG